MTAELRIRLFGGLQISLGGTPLTKFVSNKVPALLAYLAVTQQLHQRDTLAALLWGEMSDTDARNNLRQALTNLRKLAAPYLIVTRDAIAFNPHAPYTLDTQHFELHVQTSWRSNGRAPGPALQAAAELYTGDFLAGFHVRDAPAFEDWALTQKVRLRELALHALHTLTQHYLDTGCYDQAIAEATRTLSLDGWREEAHRQLMLALARTGQRSAALAQYEHCCRTLQTELGVEPAAETRRLYERIRRAAETPPYPLPSSLTAFVGREPELAELAGYLADPNCRLLTLTGPGGSGKTRLALQLGRQHTHAFLNGVCFIPLEAADPESYVTTIAHALHIPLFGAADTKQQLIQALAEQETLLILDNLEHLLDGIHWLSRLLENAPHLKILATSRARLNLLGEWVYEVGGLSIPSAQNQDDSALRLFINSAKRVRFRFAPTQADTAAIVHICQLVQGLPLAIELAAAQTSSHGIATLAAEIAQDMAVLSVSYPNLPPRHRSLRAMFDHALGRLSPAPQQAFLRLSVFKGAFDTAAAHTVTDIAPATLQMLVNRSLLQQRADGCYALHPMLQHFAAAELAARSEAAEMGTRHAAYFVQLVQRHAPGIAGGREPEALDRVSASLDNVRAAWNWAIEQQALAHIQALVEPLYALYEMRGWFEDGAALFGKAALALMEGGMSSDTAAKDTLARLLIIQGLFCVRLSRYAAAKGYLQRGVELAQQFATPQVVVRGVNALGHIAYYQKELAQAQSHYAECLALWRQIGDPVGLTVPLNNLGCVAYERGRYAEARGYLEESVALCRQHNDRWGLTFSLASLGDALAAEGGYAAARPHFQEVISIATELDAMPRLLAALVGLAELELRERRQGEAAVRLAYQTAALVAQHAAAEPDVRERAEALLTQTASLLSPALAEAARAEAAVCSPLSLAELFKTSAVTRSSTALSQL